MALARLHHVLQRHLLECLLATYVLGAFVPAPGLALRAVHLGSLPWPGGARQPLSPPLLMLGFLLLVAGLGARAEELKHVLRRPALLLVGLLANVALPIGFALVASLALRAWHSFDEAQNILVGIAMVGAMPIAGSSTAWSQNAGGNLALSLGLVLGSTVLSPLFTPLGLHAIGCLTQGDYSEDLHELAATGSGAFVIIAVVIPSAFGLALRAALGARRVARVLPALKLLTLVDLLVLNYTNTAEALPGVVRAPDWDFLALIVLVTALLCASAFATGWLLPRALGGDDSDRTAMMFGLGMNNNGTGLVLAAAALADHPQVLLPIVGYNLVQQVAAGVVDRLARRRAARRCVEPRGSSSRP